MAYNGTDWQNLPNTTTPINRNNLNKIEKRIKTYAIPTNIGDMSGWYLVLSGTVVGYNNNAFKLSVMNIFSGHSAILYINVRCDNSNELILSRFVFESNTGMEQNDFKLKLDGNNYYLYVLSSSYQQYLFKIIEASDLMSSNEDILTFNTPTYRDTVAEPTGVVPKQGGNFTTSRTVFNFNDELEVGQFSFILETLNRPSLQISGFADYGVLLVFRTDGWIQQIAIGNYGTPKLAIRSNASRGSASDWTNWVAIG